MDRYEAYRRSGLTKSSVRKVSRSLSECHATKRKKKLKRPPPPAQLVNAVLQQSVSPSILTVVRGFAKVFVGEIVEKGELSPVRRSHLDPTHAFLRSSGIEPKSLT